MKISFVPLTGFVKNFSFQIILIFITVSIVTFSCRPKYVNQTINSIDSLMLVIQQCEVKLAENYMDTLDYLEMFIKNDTDIFKSELFDMPEDKELRKAFGNYTTLGKVFKRMNESYRDVRKDISLTKNQLENLKHDLSNGLIEDQDTIQDFFTKEKEAVISIEEITNTLIDRLGSNMDYFYEINPLMDQFKAEIKDKFPDKEFSKLHKE